MSFSSSWHVAAWAIYYDYNLYQLFFSLDPDAVAAFAYQSPFCRTPGNAAVAVANEGGTHNQVVALDSLVVAFGTVHTQGVEEDSQDAARDQDTLGAEVDIGLEGAGDNPMQVVAEEHDLLAVAVQVVGEVLALAHCYAVEAMVVHETEHSMQKPQLLEAGLGVGVEGHF